MTYPFRFLLRECLGYMVFWVTQGCNARCPFCFNRGESAVTGRDLDIGEIRQLAAGLKDLQYLTLAGGEPTLRDDLADIVSAFADGTGLKMCTVVTNGFLWRQMLDVVETTARRHPRLGLNIGVSIDYLGAEHDRHRGLEGCFDGCIRIIEGIVELRRQYRNIMVCANGTYTRDNAGSILDTARYVMERYRIPFSIGLVRGEICDTALKDVSIDHYYETAREVLRLQRRYIPATTPTAPVRFALEDMAVDNIYRSVSEDRAITKCQAGRRAVVLTGNGNLRLCEILPASFGNVRDHGYDIPAMLRQPSSLSLISKVWEDQCHCTWECYSQASLAFDIRRWPELLVKSVGKALLTRR
jgi:MoaA/NifB/PqqE/SkfB family radical SAM enzyme